MFIISTVASELILFLCVFLFFLFARPLPCVCVVCGSYSMSQSWNGDHRLDQGRNNTTL